MAIIQVKDDRSTAVREVTQHIGRMIDKDFVPNDNRWEAYQRYVSSTVREQERRPNRHGQNNTYTCKSTYHRFEHPRKADGTIDERFAANRDRNKDGEADMRVAHNKSTQAQEEQLNEDGSPDMRAKEHRGDLVDESGHRLNEDGTRDMRYQENQTGMQVEMISTTFPKRVFFSIIRKQYSSS